MGKRKQKLYIAYGSNLNLEQMKRRCPDAEVVGSSKLEGYRLYFCGGSYSAVATVEPDEGSSVPILIWRISAKDEVALDRYEGYPHLYRKEWLKVELDGKKLSAMIYIMNTARLSKGLPSQSYYHTILEGYNSAGFDIAALDDAACLEVRAQSFKKQKEDFTW